MLLESEEVSYAEESAASRDQTATILLVEDEERVREVIELTLSLSGYHVLSTESSLEASRIIESQSARIDLLVTDFALPFMNGGDLAARFRRARPDAKVLFVSGFPKHDVLELEGRGARANTDFLQKPFTPEALEEKIQKLLEDTN